MEVLNIGFNPMNNSRNMFLRVLRGLGSGRVQQSGVTTLEMLRCSCLFSCVVLFVFFVYLGSGASGMRVSHWELPIEGKGPTGGFQWEAGFPLGGASGRQTSHGEGPVGSRPPTGRGNREAVLPLGEWFSRISGLRWRVVQQ